VNANVAITVTSATAISAGLVLNVQGAGAYLTVSVAGNVVTATNTGAAGNASSGTAIASGATVTTSGNSVIGCLGYTPVNKAGDTGIGKLAQTIDTVVGSAGPTNAALLINSTATNQSNDGYMPAIGFNRPNVYARAMGLSTTGRFKTVDHTGAVGYLLDTVTGVDTNSYQNASITYAKLAQSLINLISPVGIIAPFGGPNVPSGWFACDGFAVSRTTYAALFSAIGTYWGGGDGVTTFNLPDLRGRGPIGYTSTGAPGITSRPFATRGGEETHVLSVGELASHAHGINDGGHNHTLHDPGHTHTYVNPIGAFGAAAGSGQYSASGQASTGSSATGMTIDPSGTNISIQANGSNVGHNNMQPFAVVLYIIKAT
jgi:microcystin-dependent protein